MTERKSLVWFLGLTVLLSWPLFLAPLALSGWDPRQKALVTQGLWALAMWAPGLSALAVTLWVEKRPLSALRLNALGAKRFYLWAWLTPIAFTLLGGGLALLLGFAKLDLQFTMIQEAMKGAPGGDAVLAGMAVALQALTALTVGPIINMLFTVGEELGWRGYLLPKLLPLGQGKAILLSNLIWGLWHAPVIMQGHNYPGYPFAGIWMMVIFCLLAGTILSWLTLNAKSVWVAALGHGSINAVAGLPLLFFAPGVNIALAGTLAAPTAWLGMALFIFWLVRSGRLPVAEG